jgi:hypothetical protein
LGIRRKEFQHIFFVNVVNFVNVRKCPRITDTN